MTRVCITGAAGFIGRTLAREWRAGGAEVVGIDLVDDPEQQITGGDISRRGSWQRAAEGCDVVVHTAALVGMPSDTSRFWEINVRGTRLALEAARDGGAKRFVHLSSVVTFGLDFPDGVDESWPVRPTGVAYSDTKIASEQVVLQAHAAGEIEVTVVRPGDVYGPGSRPWTILPLEYLRRRRFVLPARGRGIHSPIYVDDLVAGIIRAAERRGRGRASDHAQRRGRGADPRVLRALRADARPAPGSERSDPPAARCDARLPTGWRESAASPTS